MVQKVNLVTGEAPRSTIPVQDSMMGAFEKHICVDCNRCTGAKRLENLNVVYEKSCTVMNCPTLNAVNAATVEMHARIEKGLEGTILAAEEQTAVTTEENIKEEN